MYHDSRNSWGDSPVEELEGVISNLLWGGLVFAFSTRSDHAGLEKDALKHDIVLSKVEENLSPNLLRYFESPINSMVTIKQDFRLHNRDQSTVLQHNGHKNHFSISSTHIMIIPQLHLSTYLRNGGIASKSPSCFFNCQGRWTIWNAHNGTPVRSKRANSVIQESFTSTLHNLVEKSSNMGLPFGETSTLLVVGSCAG